MNMPADQEKAFACAGDAKHVDEDEQFTAAEERSILRRVDLRLVVATALGYSVCLMDRGNVGMAAIAG